MTQDMINQIHDHFGDPLTFCEGIRRRLDRLDAPQSDLAKVLGSSPSHVFNWYHYGTGRGTEPTLGTMVKIEEALLRMERDAAERQQLGLDL